MSDNEQQETPMTLREYLKARRPRGEFEPHSYYHPDTDGVFAYWENVPSHELPINPYLYIERAFDDGRVVGVKLFGIKGMVAKPWKNPPQPLEEVTMSAESFAYWLQGFFEIAGDSHPALTLSNKQVETIKRHLAMVFAHDLDKKAGGPEVQAKLDAIHTPAPFHRPPVMRC